VTEEWGGDGFRGGGGGSGGAREVCLNVVPAEYYYD